VRLPQVSCERYDAKALFKKWDTVYITMSSSLMAYGSTEDKAVNRALGISSAADGNMSIPTAGCVCTAVARDGRPHVMSVSFPATPGVPEHCFAFATFAARDSFMRMVQAKSPSAFVSCQVAVEEKNAVGSEALAKVNLTHPAAARLVSIVATRNCSIGPQAHFKH
jgi:hypothetical protein